MMYKKFAIFLISIFFLTLSAIAASDNELVLSKNEQTKKLWHLSPLYINDDAF